MSGHTPGPWFDQGYSVYSATPQDLPAGFRGFKEPEIPGGYLIAESIPHDATRRLIAAAPDLLAALRMVGVWVLEHQDADGADELFNVVRDALRKAGAADDAAVSAALRDGAERFLDAFAGGRE